MKRLLFWFRWQCWYLWGDYRWKLDKELSEIEYPDELAWREREPKRCA